MFRPNRIGTPYIHQDIISADTTNFTLAQAALTTANYPFNAINGTPILDFGTTILHWTGTEAVTALNRFAFGQQFTITAPLNGDTVGLELHSFFQGSINISTIMIPFIAKVTTPLALLAGAVLASSPTMFGTSINAYSGQAAAVQQLRIPRGYKEQVIVRDTTRLFGTYCHGYIFEDNSAAGWNLIDMHWSAGVRQLNDQQAVGYRDTRR